MMQSSQAKTLSLNNSYLVPSNQFALLCFLLLPLSPYLCVLFHIEHDPQLRSDIQESRGHTPGNVLLLSFRAPELYQRFTLMSH